MILEEESEFKSDSENDQVVEGADEDGHQSEPLIENPLSHVVDPFSIVESNYYASRHLNSRITQLFRHSIVPLVDSDKLQETIETSSLANAIGWTVGNTVRGSHIRLTIAATGIAALLTLSEKKILEESKDVQDVALRIIQGYGSFVLTSFFSNSAIAAIYNRVVPEDNRFYTDFALVANNILQLIGGVSGMAVSASLNSEDKDFYLKILALGTLGVFVSATATMEHLAPKDRVSDLEAKIQTLGINIKDLLSQWGVEGINVDSPESLNSSILAIKAGLSENVQNNISTTADSLKSSYDDSIAKLKSTYKDSIKSALEGSEFRGRGLSDASESAVNNVAVVAKSEKDLQEEVGKLNGQIHDHEGCIKALQLSLEAEKTKNTTLLEEKRKLAEENKKQAVKLEEALAKAEQYDRQFLKKSKEANSLEAVQDNESFVDGGVSKVNELSVSSSSNAETSNEKKLDFVDIGDSNVLSNKGGDKVNSLPKSISGVVGEAVGVYTDLSVSKGSFRAMIKEENVKGRGASQT